MTLQATHSIATTVPVCKQTGARVSDVIHVLNANVAITETTLRSGTFNVVNAGGILVPNAAPGASLGAAGNVDGTVDYAVTLYDSTRDVEGNPSSTVQIVATNDQVQIDLTPITNEATNTRVTHFRIYRTLGAGSTGVFYFLAQVTIATTGYTDNSADATISANDSLLTDNDAPVIDTYGTVKAHKSYLWRIGGYNPLGGTAYDHRAAWGKVGNGDVIPALNIVDITPGMHGRLVGAEDCGDALIFYKEFGIFELHYDSNPSGVFGDGFGKMMNSQRGALNQRCIVNVQGTHFVMDASGVYVNAGGTAQREISRPLDAYWKRINWNAHPWFWGSCDEMAIYFAVALDDDTLPRHVFVFDLSVYHAGQPGVWTVYEYDQALVDGARQRFGWSGAAAMYGMHGATVVEVITEYGHTGYLRAGYRDMVDPLLTATGTVGSSASTTTFVASSGTFTRTNDNSDTSDVRGAMVYFKLQDADMPVSGWTRPFRVTAVSGTTITFDPAAPTTIPAGTQFVIGRIPNARIATPVMGGDTPWASKRNARVALEFLPCGMPVSVRLYNSLDRKAALPAGFTSDAGAIEHTQYDQGVVVQMGGALLDGGRIGVLATPPAGQGWRTLQVILEASDVDCPAAIDGIFVDEVELEINNVP
jgi:hypothetical protein